MSFIAQLAGGGGRVLVDVAKGLAPRPQAVVCLDPGSYTSQGLREELDGAGIPVVVAGAAERARRLIRTIAPGVAIHLWWAAPEAEAPLRAGRERWNAVGHTPLPMPTGFDAYVSLSAFHARYQAHLPPERLRRIPNGIDLSRFAPRARTRRRRGEPGSVTIVAVSRLDPGKFPRRLIHHLPDLRALGARLVVAGWGPRRYEIEPDARRLGIGGDVRFLGGVPSARIPELLAGSDIGLHLTEVHEETCPLAVIEMLAAGLPIVAEPRGAIREMVFPGENGFLAEGEAEVAAALERLVRSSDLRKRFGAASRRLAGAYDLRLAQAAYRDLVDGLNRSEVGRVG